MSTHPIPASHDNPETHHEESDVNVRAIAGFGAALIAVAIVVHVVVWLLYVWFAGQANREYAAREFPLSTQQADRMPAEPRLQTSPREDLRNLRTQEDAILNTYGWVDRNSGVVRIPITEAMKLTLERGLPARASAPQAPGGSPAAPAANPDANSGQAASRTESGK